MSNNTGSGPAIRKALPGDETAIKVLMSTYFLDIEEVSMDDLVVAEKDGRIIGAAAITSGDIVELHSIAVHPNHRGKGLGSSLLRELLSGYGYTGNIYVRTTSPVFFLKLGFRELKNNVKAELWDDCATCNKLNRCRQSVLCLEEAYNHESQE